MDKTDQFLTNMGLKWVVDEEGMSPMEVVDRVALEKVKKKKENPLEFVEEEAESIVLLSVFGIKNRLQVVDSNKFAKVANIDGILPEVELIKNKRIWYSYGDDAFKFEKLTKSEVMLETRVWIQQKNPLIQQLMPEFFLKHTFEPAEAVEELEDICVLVNKRIRQMVLKDTLIHKMKSEFIEMLIDRTQLKR